MSEPIRLPSADALELKQRLEVAEWLQEIARHIGGNDYLDGPMTRALVIMWGPNGPKVTWHGRFLRPELEWDTGRIIRAAIDPEIETRRAEWQAAQDAEREAYLVGHPFVCDIPGWCQSRYATEGGLRGHRTRVAKVHSQCLDWSHRCGGHPCGKLGAKLPEPPVQRPVLRPVALAMEPEDVMELGE